MTRTKGFSHSVARRVAMASMTVLAASGVGLVAAPMAFGQIVIPIGGSSQGTSVVNSGSASANSGGNAAIGNNSTNTVTVPATAGLVGVGVNVGGAVNNSTGRAEINTGAANAVGNNSGTNIGQTSLEGGTVGGAGVGAGPCGTGRFGSIQQAAVRNEGHAEANTGNNVAVGNASTNDAAVNPGQTVSGGLLGVGLTIGGPVNNSSGTAVINTGPANAVGNNSVTQVGQTEGCPQVTTLTAAGVIVPAPKGHVVRHATLARTGLDTGDLGMIAGALLGAGMLLVASQRRRMVARSAAVPMAGFGFGLGGNDWDGPVR